MKLFEIAQEFEGLYSLLEEVETDEDGAVVDNSETIASLYSDIKGELTEKLDNSVYICKELIANAKTLKEEAKRLTEKAKAFENNEKKIKQLMKEVIIQSGEMKLKTNKFSINVRTSEVYNYDDVNLFGVSDEFIKTVQSLDKTLVKKFIKAGGTIDGVRVTEDTIISVR